MEDTSAVMDDGSSGITSGICPCVGLGSLSLHRDLQSDHIRIHHSASDAGEWVVLSGQTERGSLIEGV